jgi:hypothetical protein
MQHNKPDIVVHDKVENEIIIVEVGITSQDQLQTVEVGKIRKYTLAKELRMIYKCKTTIIPNVLTWNGIVTRSFHKKDQKQLGVDRYIGAYIQSADLNRTFESISLEF